MPKPYGHALAPTFVGGGGGAAPVCPAPTGVPLDAAPNDENTDDWFLSGGASGENEPLAVGCSRGGRNALGSTLTATMSAIAR